MIDPRRSRTASEASEHHSIRPGQRRLSSCSASCTRCSPTAWCASAAWPSTSPGSRRCAQLARELRARGRRAALRHRRRRHPPPGARAGGGAERRRCTRASAPARRSSARLTSWLVDVVNVLTGHLDQPGRRHVHPPGDAARRTRAARRAAARACASAAATAACAARPRSTASCRPPAWPRRSRRRARDRCGR